MQTDFNRGYLFGCYCSNFIDQPRFADRSNLKSQYFRPLGQIVFTIRLQHQAPSIFFDFARQQAHDTNTHVVIHRIATDDNDWPDTALFIPF